MSRECLIKTLESLGFKQLDAEVYIYLLQNEPQKSKTIAAALEINENKIYRSLKRLQYRGLVKTSQIRAVNFYAISFEEVLDQLIRENREEAQRTEENKQQIIKLWRLKFLGR